MNHIQDDLQPFCIILTIWTLGLERPKTGRVTYLPEDVMDGDMNEDGGFGETLQIDMPVT